MIKLQKALFACLLIFLLVAGMAVSASADVNLTVGSNWVWSESGDTVEVDITVDNPETLAGASFTITYSDSLTLDSVESSFFDTFANQFTELENPPDPYPVLPVVVDGDPYTQPLITNESDAGLRVAAARCTPAGEGGKTTIFTLTFSLNEGAAPGKYAVDIIATELDNQTAGYDSDGEAIPMLVGADLDILDLTDPNAFPVLTAATADPDAGSVAFYTDTDSDNLPDEWEKDHFDGDLGATDGTEDSDDDGYSDAQEFANETDPEIKDDPDGEGYNENTDERVPKEQRVYVSPLSPAAAPESNFTIDVYYDAPETALDGLELRIFFDSDVIFWSGVSDEVGSPEVSAPISDEGSDLDGDPTTDWYVTVDYSLERGWPGATPIMLFAAGFAVEDVVEGTTCNIKIDAEPTGGLEYTFSSDLIKFEARNYTLGDVDNNGLINVFDVIKVARASLYLENVAPFIPEAADLDQNGSVNVFDVIKTARLSLHLD